MSGVVLTVPGPALYAIVSGLRQAAATDRRPERRRAAWDAYQHVCAELDRWEKAEARRRQAEFEATLEDGEVEA